jgi:hypothetical protein
MRLLAATTVFVRLPALEHLRNCKSRRGSSSSVCSCLRVFRGQVRNTLDEKATLLRMGRCLGLTLRRSNVEGVFSTVLFLLERTQRV